MKEEATHEEKTEPAKDDQILEDHMEDLEEEVSALISWRDFYIGIKDLIEEWSPSCQNLIVDWVMQKTH